MPRPAAPARWDDGRDHDAAVAAISHLPLVVAAALVEAVAGAARLATEPDWPAAAGLAASGWAGMTRLARGDVAMGAGIVATNAPAIAGRLRELRAALDGWLDELDGTGGPDAAAIAARLTSRAAAAAGREASSDAPSELVLVVPRHAVIDGAGLARASGPAGLDDVPRGGRRATAGSSRGPRWRSIRRFKQVIPYLVLRDGERYFLMRRTRAGGDARLHDRWSIGVGGHLNPGDGDLAGGLRREWARGARRGLRARSSGSSAC